MNNAAKAYILMFVEYQRTEGISKVSINVKGEVRLFNREEINELRIKIVKKKQPTENRRPVII